jgi:hypothetical protein
MKAKELLRSDSFVQAVAAIRKRAEKNTDMRDAAQVFVKTELFQRVYAHNSQLLLGRRGTGKTHLVRALQAESVSHGLVARYIDCSILGRAHTDSTVPPEEVASRYFSAFLNQLGTDLLDEVSSLELASERKVNELLSRLAQGYPMEPATSPGEVAFNYRQINDTLRAVLRGLSVDRLILILDEWVQIPLVSQPFFAEHLKRAVLSVPEITVKVLAVNYQCNLAVRDGNNLVGLERGADLPDVIDMDRYLVWDEKRDFVSDYFYQLLYNHLGIGLRQNLTIPLQEKKRWVDQLFTQRKAFTELVRAAEGNSRDFLCVFSRAYYDEYRQNPDSETISVKNVINAAAWWYEEGKWNDIRNDTVAQNTLTHIINGVLKDRKSRSFLVEADKAEHQHLVRLLNARILHRLNNAPSHADKPGLKYELFTVDYGAYVKLRTPNDQIHDDVYIDAATADGLPDAEKELLVPLDDKRRIRRITFDPESLTASGRASANTPEPVAAKAADAATADPDDGKPNLFNWNKPPAPQ